MYHKGLTRELVVETAVRLIEEKGTAVFSLHNLAAELGVRTASLYKHVSGMEDVITEVGLYALETQKEAQITAIGEKHGDEAVMELAKAYRRYALEHRELYKTIFSMRLNTDEFAGDKAEMITEPVMKLLDDYPLREQEKMHWQRVLRSSMHGFITHEEAGYFVHDPAEKEDTYRILIQSFLDGMHAALSRDHEQNESE